MLNDLLLDRSIGCYYTEMHPNCQYILLYNCDTGWFMALDEYFLIEKNHDFSNLKYFYTKSEPQNYPFLFLYYIQNMVCKLIKQ